MAKIENPVLSPSVRDLSGTEFLSRLLPNLITLFFIAAAVVALFFMVSGGIRWITSGGDREKTAKARETITSAVIGLMLVLLVYAALGLIGYFFDLDLIHLDLGPVMLS
jgi:succinate dehydrogenase/fumarate reductase cytochrome b subunit